MIRNIYSNTQTTRTPHENSNSTSHRSVSLPSMNKYCEFTVRKLSITFFSLSPKIEKETNTSLLGVNCSNAMLLLLFLTNPTIVNTFGNSIHPMCMPILATDLQLGSCNTCNGMAFMVTLLNILIVRESRYSNRPTNQR